MSTGVLLINLGTPDSPCVKDVRKFLKQFFSDPFVIDIPGWKRMLLRNLIILPFRSPKSAKLYQQIWTEDGSPLMVHSLNLVKGVREAFDSDYQVELGMGYGSPSIADAVARFDSKHIKKLIVLPLFPQCASSTTGSVKAGLARALEGKDFDKVEVIDHFYSNARFIEAWTERAIEHDLSTYDHILFSFHGLPERHIIKDDPFGNCLQDRCCEAIDARNSDCYRAQCHETTRRITASLNLPTNMHSMSFQSRLGKSPWIMPYTEDTIIKLAEKGHKKLLVFAPSFVADCLETLQEIAIEYKELFIEHGGGELTLVESLNNHPAWVQAIKAIVEQPQNATTSMGS